MLYPILSVVCLLLRGHLSLQRKDTNSSYQSSNEINTSINSCNIEELSRLLTDRIAMIKALELAALKENKPKEELIETILKTTANLENTDSNAKQETISSKDNEIQKIVDNQNSPSIIAQNFPKLMTSHSESDPKISDLISQNVERPQFHKTNNWPIDSSPYSYSLPLFIPHRNPKPPPGATIIIEFKGKKREVTVTVSPLMTVLESLKQAEIKFKRIFKGIPLDSDLISLWWSQTLGCIIVDRVSTIENNKSMMWRMSVIDSNGEIEFKDFCLPANGEVFIKPGSTIQLVYTSVRDVKDIY